MKRSILVLLSVLMALVMVLPAAAQEDESITVWLTGSDNDAAALQVAADAYAETTGISVTVEAVPWSDSYTRALGAVNSGDGADILMGGMSWGISLGEIGGLVDLEDEFGEAVADLLAVNNPAFIDAVVGISGDVYTVPYNQDVFVMYYSTAAFEEAGIEAAPETWEDFTAALDALEEAGLGGGAFGWGNASWLSYQNYLYQAGGQWYGDDCSASAVNSDEALEALEFYTFLFDDYGFPAEQADPGTSFSTGERSIVISGEWHTTGIDAAFPELEGTWAIAPLPAGPSGENPAFLGGRGASIFSFSESKQAAFDFLVWLATPEAAEIISNENFELGALHLPPQPENGQFIRGGEMVNTAVNTQLANVSAPPNCPGWEENQAEINLIIQSVLFEEGNFEDALEDMEELMNDGLEEYGS